MTRAAHSMAEMRRLLPSIENPSIAEFAEYWMSIHPQDRLPSRENFDPVEIPRLLPHIVLVDVESDPLRFQVRVQGTEVCRAMGRDLKGHYLDESFEDFESTYPYIDRRRVVETGLPTHRLGSPSLPFALDFIPIERLHLPLSTDGRTVDKVLSIFLYQQKHKNWLVDRTF
ncbi:PAS domain-containing protein [Nisaea sp.]|uniref:PAS domain-containing protein n=1 Tax=Nisaea sp. TaxID=2024842 RepID=UPI003B52FC06